MDLPPDVQKNPRLRASSNRYTETGEVIVSSLLLPTREPRQPDARLCGFLEGYGEDEERVHSPFLLPVSFGKKPRAPDGSSGDPLGDCDSALEGICLNHFPQAVDRDARYSPGRRRARLIGRCLPLPGRRLSLASLPEEGLHEGSRLCCKCRSCCPFPPSP